MPRRMRRTGSSARFRVGLEPARSGQCRGHEGSWTGSGPAARRARHPAQECLPTGLPSVTSSWRRCWSSWAPQSRQRRRYVRTRASVRVPAGGRRGTQPPAAGSGPPRRRVAAPRRCRSGGRAVGARDRADAGRRLRRGRPHPHARRSHEPTYAERVVDTGAGPARRRPRPGRSHERRSRTVVSRDWVAASVRARALARRRLGPAGARRLAASAGADEAISTLADTSYGHDVRVGDSMATAQHGIGAALLWNLRVLGGWVPRTGVPALRALAAAFEVANIEEHMRSLHAEPRTDVPPRLLRDRVATCRRLDQRARPASGAGDVGLGRPRW